jgi:predicted Fe-Mo cluster-binding NifX family protein
MFRETALPMRNPDCRSILGKRRILPSLQRILQITRAYHRYLKNPFKDLERKKGVKTAELLAEYGVDQVRSPVQFDGKGAGYALEAMQIEVVPTDSRTLEGLIADIKGEKNPEGGHEAPMGRDGRFKYNEKFLEFIKEFSKIGADSRIFPKTCRTCGTVYHSFPEYIHNTSPLPTA